MLEVYCRSGYSDQEGDFHGVQVGKNFLLESYALSEEMFVGGLVLLLIWSLGGIGMGW